MAAAREAGVELGAVAAQFRLLPQDLALLVHYNVFFFPRPFSFNWLRGMWCVVVWECVMCGF